MWWPTDSASAGMPYALFRSCDNGPGKRSPQPEDALARRRRSAARAEALGELLKIRRIYADSVDRPA
jgi:hypothetical protein